MNSQIDARRYCAGCIDAPYDERRCARCSWSDAADQEIQTSLPLHYVLMERYYIGKVLGQGGFGITYLARDLRLNRLLAIKEYFPSEQCVRLSHGHPNIISITDFARENGTAYLMMSFVDGTTLREYLRKNGGRISSPLAIDLMSRVLSALREMHSKGLLHRDGSPSNIMITRQGTVKLVDFGAARYAMGEQSKSMSIILKPGYAPEEQYRSKGRQGQWTDVYSATATLYQCITGVIPPPAPDRLVEDELEAPSALVADLSPMIEKVLLMGLAVRAADRYQTVDEMQRALSGLSRQFLIRMRTRPGS